jgi:hypothetical protein
MGKRGQRTRAELTAMQARRPITDARWETFIRCLVAGYATAKALEEAKIIRAQYNAILIIDEEKREQAEIARDQWMRSSWPDETFQKICGDVAMGELAKVAIPRHAPPHLDDPIKEFYKVKNLDPIFKSMWTDARQTAMEIMSDECLEIVDNTDDDVIQGRDKFGNAAEISNPSAVRRAEARVKARQWQMERLHSKQFGNKVQAEVSVKVEDPALVLANARKRKKETGNKFRSRLEKQVEGVVVEAIPEVVGFLDD